MKVWKSFTFWTHCLYSETLNCFLVNPKKGSFFLWASVILTRPIFFTLSISILETIYISLTSFFLSETCGVELAATEEFRYLTTSNYPDSYSGELICTWTISTFNNYMVEVVAEFDHDLESCCESLEVCFI